MKSIPGTMESLDWADHSGDTSARAGRTTGLAQRSFIITLSILQENFRLKIGEQYLLDVAICACAFSLQT